MKISFAFGNGFKMPDVQYYRDVVSACDKAGFEMVMSGDSPARMGDPYVGLTVMAHCTQHCRIGTSVTNPVTRHPAVTACAISTVDAVSGGRAVLGISSGDSGVYSVGRKASSVDFLEEYIAVLRALWKNGEAKYQGQTVQFNWSRKPIPIYMAPGGPKGLRLAGRIADGVLLGSGVTPEVIRDSLAHLAAGAKEAGRRVEDIDVWWFVKANFGASVDDAAHHIRSGLASSANHTFRFSLEGKFVPDRYRDALQKLQSQYNFMHHVKPGEGPNADLVDKLGLRDYLMERFGLLGTPEDWKKRIESLAEHGVRKIFFAGVMEDRLGVINTLAREVMPAFSR